MTELLTPQDIAENITKILSRNPFWQGKSLNVYFIANRTAGCFTQKKKSAAYKKLLAAAGNDCSGKPEVISSVRSVVYCTEYPCHAKELADGVLAEVIASDGNPDNTAHILVTAGGDGTSLEIQTALFNAAASSGIKRDAVMNRITVIRLPLGTGNDGTDGHSLEETLRLLSGPVRHENARAVKVSCQGDEDGSADSFEDKNPSDYNDGNFPAPWYAFNIASIGLDAYVTYMTNKMKSKMPGNSYHLCVSLSALVYDKAFPPGTAEIEFFDGDGNLMERKVTQIELVAVGISGHRTYGGGHKILPTDENVCLVPKLPLPALIAKNGKFLDGSFVGTDLASLHSAEKIRVNYDRPALVQFDGEAVLVGKKGFPVVFELTEPCIRILRPCDGN